MLSTTIATFTFFTCLFLSTFGMPTTGYIQPRNMYGRATWYYPGRGSCGEVNTNSDLIVAIAPSVYANGAHCDHNIKITDPSTGHTALAVVRDTCPSCKPGDLDMSPALFQHFKSLDAGTFNMNWYFL